MKYPSHDSDYGGTDFDYLAYENGTRVYALQDRSNVESCQNRMRVALASLAAEPDGYQLRTVAGKEGTRFQEYREGFQWRYMLDM